MVSSSSSSSSRQALVAASANNNNSQRGLANHSHSNHQPLANHNHNKLVLWVDLIRRRLLQHQQGLGVGLVHLPLLVLVLEAVAVGLQEVLDSNSKALQLPQVLDSISKALQLSQRQLTVQEEGMVALVVVLEVEVDLALLLNLIKLLGLANNHNNSNHNHNPQWGLASHNHYHNPLLDLIVVKNQYAPSSNKDDAPVVHPVNSDMISIPVVLVGVLLHHLLQALEVLLRHLQLQWHLVPHQLQIIHRQMQDLHLHLLVDLDQATIIIITVILEVGLALLLPLLHLGALALLLYLHPGDLVLRQEVVLEHLHPHLHHLEDLVLPLNNLLHLEDLEHQLRWDLDLLQLVVDSGLRHLHQCLLHRESLALHPQQHLLLLLQLQLQVDYLVVQVSCVSYFVVDCV